MTMAITTINLGRVQGSMWYTGTANTNTTISNQLTAAGVISLKFDIYINTENGNIFQYIPSGKNLAWTLQGNIKGVQGDRGPTGVLTVKYLITAADFTGQAEGDYYKIIDFPVREEYDFTNLSYMEVVPCDIISKTALADDFVYITEENNMPKSFKVMFKSPVTADCNIAAIFYFDSLTA